MKRTLAFLLLAAAATFGLYLQQQSLADRLQDAQRATATRLQNAQVAACHRGNLLREESNRRIPAHNADRDALREFLIAARTARRRSGKPFDLEAVAKYTELIHRLSKVRFYPTALVNCELVVRNPDGRS